MSLLYKIVEAAEPVNPYDNYTAVLLNVPLNVDIDCRANFAHLLG